MCESCYAEAGSPVVITDAVKLAVPLIKELYTYAPTGGHLHVVTDDWNIETEHIEFCAISIDDPQYLQYYADMPVEYYTAMIAIERQIAALLLGMSEDERHTALALFWKIITV